MQAINEVGIQAIHDFLAKNHKLGGDHFTRSMLMAWAAEAEFQLGEGNTPTIEVRSWDSVSGHAVTFTVPSAGVEVVE